MGNFSVMDFFADTAAKAEQSQQGIRLISARKLVASNDNFYSTEDVQDLKASIAMLGVLQNLVVMQVAGEDRYIIKAGHRRHKAVMELLAEGRNDLEMVPCNVIRLDNPALEKLVLIFTNATARELTAYEKMEQAEQARAALEQLQAQGFKLKGRTRDYVADMLKTSAAQIARMAAVRHNLTEPLKEHFKAGDINASTAYELSKLDAEQQQQVAERVAQGERVDIKAAKAIKAETPAEPAPKREAEEKPTPKREADDVPQITMAEPAPCPAAAGQDQRAPQPDDTVSGVVARLIAVADAMAAGAKGVSRVVSPEDAGEIAAACRLAAKYLSEGAAV